MGKPWELGCVTWLGPCGGHTASATAARGCAGPVRSARKHTHTHTPHITSEVITHTTQWNVLI